MTFWLLEHPARFGPGTALVWRGRAFSYAAILEGAARWSRELGPSGIRVNSVAPGYFESDMTRGLTAEPGGYSLPALPGERVYHGPDPRSRWRPNLLRSAMENLEKEIREAILEVVRETNPSITWVEDHQQLHADLGVKSLDLARIVASLELSLEADPFAELVAITSARTVGDLIGAYRRSLAGGAAPEESAEGRRRARARQEALAGLGERRRPTRAGEPDAA
jgi:acyl carrier protein